MASSNRLDLAAICVRRSLSCLQSIDWFKELKDIDWYDEIRLVAAAVLLASIITSVIILVNIKYPDFPIWSRLDNWIRLPDPVVFPRWLRLPNWIWLRNLVLYFNMNALLFQDVVVAARGRQIRTCPPPRVRASPYEPSHRIRLTESDVCVFSWPSKGGVVILEHTEAADLEFLGLDPLNPPVKRLANQNDEDVFCRRLLLLGAKWWDNEARFRLLAMAMGDDCGSPEAVRAFRALEEETEPSPSIKERRWVSVAWPTTGGLWVAEFDTALWGVMEAHNLLPRESATLKLARTMDERSQVLRDHFRPKFYKDVRDYKGYAFLNSWDEKENGEVGPLTPPRR